MLLSVASTMSLTGCMDDDLETPEPTPTAYVSFYHGSPDAPDMDIQRNSQSILNQPIKYSNFSGYAPLIPESTNFKFTPVNAATAYLDTTLSLKDGEAYSLFAVNRLEDIELLVVQDSIVTPATGKVALRIVHLSPDAPAVNVSTTGSASTELAAGLGFKNITLFKELDAGRHTIEIKDADTDAVLLTVSQTNFELGRAYTLIVRGFATPPSGNTNTLAAQVIRNY
ncbi:DUF4397 domain-containing protein [Pontibacter korlensis]